MSRIQVEQLNEEEKSRLKIPASCRSEAGWAVWSCEPSTFDWHYDSVEKAYVYEGRVKVKTDDEEVEIKAGDFVTFPKDMDCTWEVLETIRKVYRFE